MTRWFAFDDAVEIAKAVAVTTVLTYIAVFTWTLLEGVARSVPIIHALILAAGLIGARISTSIAGAMPSTNGTFATPLSGLTCVSFS